MWFPTMLSALWLAAFAAGADAAEPETRSIPLRTHSLTQPYLESDMQSRWWDFGGDTIIRADKYVRLTADRPSRDGWIFSRFPLSATNWEIEVEFQIHGEGNLHGDGMAMWVTKQRAQRGPVFGFSDHFEGLGIFIDTYKNNRPGTVFPYVMAVYNEPDKTPISYDKNNDGKENEYAGCSARGIRGATVPTKLRLTYFQDKTLKLELQYKQEDQWILCFEKDDPPQIPGLVYLGFSAETGELSDNHDIINVQSRSIYSASLTGASQSSGIGIGRQGNRYDPTRKPGGSWTWFLIKIVLFFVLVAGGYVGYTMWRTSKKNHRF